MRLPAVAILLQLIVTGCTLNPSYLEPRLPTQDCPPQPDFLAKVDAQFGFNSSNGAQAPLPCLKFYEDAQNRPGQDEGTAVAVAISGGGHRAANFALGVMLALEDFRPDGSERNLLREVDYFSSVSGGGLAVGAYLANLHDKLERSTDKTAELQRYSLAREAFLTRTYLRRDLARGLQRSLYRAALQPGLERGDYLEQRIDDVILRADTRGRSLTLGDMFVPNCSLKGISINERRCSNVATKRQVLLPYWFANAGITRNGAIFPFAPDILALYRITEYRHRRATEILTDPYELPVAVAAKASAAFPVGVPETVLKGKIPQNPKAKRTYEYIHLLDGGIADNLGVMTALNVLQQDDAPRKVLIIVDAYTGTYQPFSGARKAFTAIPILRRTTSVYLDSWRGRHRYVVEAMAQGLAKDEQPWKVVFLSFDELLANESLFEELGFLRGNHAETDELYRTVRNIGTKLNISEKEQQALLEAGMLVVDSQKKSICEAFGMTCATRPKR